MELRIEYMALISVKPAPRNPKEHDLGAINQSITRFGYADAVILDERTGRLVSGHGRVETLESMRRDKRPAPEGVKVDAAGEWLVPVQRGWASKSDADAEAFLVAANRLGEVGGYNDQTLQELLVDLAKRGPEMLVGTGFDGDDVDKMVADALRAAEKDQEPPLEMPPSSFQILVTCRNEAAQSDLLSKLMQEGFDCRSLIG